MRNRHYTGPGLAALLLLGSLALSAQTTLEECQTLARKNYPLVAQYGLIARTTDYSLSNAARAWLPQVTLSAQASYQSDVATFPNQMKSAYEAMGLEVKGLNKGQYRAAVDVTQTVWDGGASRAERQAARAAGAADAASNEVQLYALRERVDNLFFGVLLLNKQAQQNLLLQALLESNVKRAQASMEGGTAMQSDVDAVQAELLSTRQQFTQITASQEAYRAMLSLFAGRQLDSLVLPPLCHSDTAVNMRPELDYMMQLEHKYAAQEEAVKASTMPRLGLSFSGFYGNPGLNLFKDMMENRATWNYVAGVKLQWNIGSFYTRGNNLRKISLARNQVALQRETFLFNTRLQVTEQQRAVERMRAVSRQDGEIVSLREAVRRAAEAKWQNGVIDMTTLLREITSENSARVAAATHEIELLKGLYELKNTLNN